MVNAEKDFMKLVPILAHGVQHCKTDSGNAQHTPKQRQPNYL
jgi:hypothetical protein